MELKDMKIKTFKEFLEDKTNPVVYCLLSSNGKDFLAKESYKVELHQYNCQHDTFTIETPEDSFDKFHEYIMEHSRDLLGEPLTIKFYQYGKVVQHFSGIITRIYCKRQTGSGYGTLYISGNAPSILLDQGKACHSYENKTLKEIITLVSEGYDNSAQVDSSAGVNTTRALPYTVQYNESDYDFICRLANLYGEYFYYDGSKLIFGNKLQETIELGENLNLIDEDFTLEMKPQEFEYIAYDFHRSEVYKMEAKDAACEYKNNPIQTDAKNASKKLLKKTPQKYHSATSLEQSYIDLEEVVRQERDLRELSLKVTGRSRDPRLRMNTFACLTDINARAMETYRVIKISHYHSGMNYENSFEAIPMMRTPADYNAEAFPRAEQQPAIVKDNNDPQGMGRVRVQFFWQKGEQLSPWIRMIQPYAGSSKGFYFIPEVGEEVMVDFENGNAERPFVLGAHYNGAAKSGYKPTTKAIHTQSGTKILLNDEDGSIKIEDAVGNSLIFDGNQKITLSSSIFEINTQQMLIRATDKLHITTNNYVLNVLSQLYIFTAWMKQQVSGFMQVFSNAALIKSTNTLDIEAKEAKLSGKERAVLDSKKEVVVNSLGVAQLQGKQGNEYSNNGQGIAQAPLEEIGLAVVYFRPLEDWRGEFGFDWMRDKYFPFKNELAYKDIISSGYSTKEDEHGKRRDLTKDEAYSQLRGEYEHHPMQIDGIDENEYFAPYLTLFSKTFVDTLGIAPFARPKYEATLQLIVGIERELESFYIECTNPERINIRTEGLTDKNTTSLKKGGTITITCNQDLDKNEEICIYAYPKGTHNREEAKLAGKLIILKNDRSTRKEKKIVLVKIETDIDKNGKNEREDFSLEEKTMLYNALHQALIIPIVEYTTLNLSSNSEFQIGGDFIVDGKIQMTSPTIRERVYNRLQELFFQQNARYRDNYFTIFKFGVESNKDGLLGETQDIKTENVIIFTLPRGNEDYTLAHETLHGLGLYHTHREVKFVKIDGYETKLMMHDEVIIPYDRSNKKYIYFYGSTTNIMSYGTLNKFTTWHWQWLIINPNLRTFNL